MFGPKEKGGSAKPTNEIIANEDERHLLTANRGGGTNHASHDHHIILISTIIIIVRVCVCVCVCVVAYYCGCCVTHARSIKARESERRNDRKLKTKVVPVAARFR